MSSLSFLERCNLSFREVGNTSYMKAMALLSLSIGLSTTQAQGPVSSAFTFQGRLVEAGVPANGMYDLQFRLFTGPTTPPGVQVGGTQVFDNVPVTNGLFTLSVDFGNQFNGSARWLDIGVHPGALPVGNPYTLLIPRQELTAAPYAQAVRLPLSESISSTSSSLSISNTGTGHAGAFHGPDNNGTTAALAVSSGSQTMLLDGNELDSLDPGGLFLNNNVDSNVVLASGGGHVGVGNTAPPASLTVGSPSFLNVFVPGDSTCFQAHATSGCSDVGCENLVCATDTFCCNNAWDSVCVGQANSQCIGRVGIGTTAAEVRLHIAGGTDTSLESGGFLVAGSVAGSNISIDNNEIMARNNGDPATLAINADGGNVNIAANGVGNVGIGLNSNDAKLHVRNAGRPIKCDRTGSDGELLAWARDDTVVGLVTVTGGSVSYGAFTGSHWAWMPQALDRGTLVTMTGENRRSSADSEVIYGVAETTKPNDAACLGAYLAPLIVGESPETTDQHQIMSVGNGELWVIDSGQDIGPGDLLIASHVPGCAMKDDPARFPVGHIVARAAEAVRWQELKTEVEGIRRVRISVLFDRFTRGADAAALSAVTGKLQELRARLERLEQELENAKSHQ